MANIKKVANASLTRPGTFIADVPDTPTIGTATDVGTSRAFNNGSATVTVSPATGGIPTSYTVTSSPGGFSANGTSPVTVTGLQSETSYTFTATATGGGYTSGSSSSSNSITATTVPQNPTIGTATDVGSGRAFNNGRADVTFTAPASTGGKTITGYTVTSSPGSLTGTGSSSPITVTGLNSAQGYTYTVTATNANGTSISSSASPSVTATTVPQAPTIGVSLAYPNFSMTISGSNGGSTITSYEYSTNGGTNWKALAGTTSPQTISTQSNNSAFSAGVTYSFILRATNVNGTSNVSNSVNALYGGVPGPPTGVSAIPAYNSRNITVSFTAPADNGGVSITSYTATASPGGATVSGSSSPLTFTGLSIGTGYTITVAATNAVGTGSASSPSSTVYPIDVAYSTGSWNTSITSTTPVLINSLSASSTNNAPTAFFWTGNIYSSTSTTLDVLVKIASGSSILTDIVTQNMEPQDLNDVISSGGFYYSSAYPSSNSVYQYAWVENSASQGAGFRELLRLCLDSGSVAVYNQNSVASTSTVASSLCNNVTVPTNGNYLLIATSSVNISATNATASQVFVRETGQFGPIPGSIISASTQSPIVSTDTTNYFPYWYIQKISNKANTSYSLEITSGGGSFTATGKGSGLILLNLDAFKAHYYDQPADVTTTSLFGNNIGRTSTFSIASPSNAHLIFASGYLTGTSTAYYSESTLINRDTSQNAATHRRELNAANEEYPFVIGEVWKNVNNEIDWRLYTQNAANTAGLKSMRLCVIDTGIAGSNFP